MTYEVKKYYTIGDIRSVIFKEEVEITIKTHNRDLLIRLDDELKRIIDELKEEAKED